MIDTKVIREKFFNDPDWRNVEEMLMEYINTLIVMSDVNVKQPATDVKAELIGRQKLHAEVCRFLESTGIVANTKNYKGTNQFR